ncbi:hypothetical protein P7H14_12890 [Paenibacillus larvae]|nr:hypothetical protein [Paenibacillus larvae]MDT2192894.1 hypothetical protein [Paenibacillus larvae]
MNAAAAPAKGPNTIPAHPKDATSAARLIGAKRTEEIQKPIYGRLEFYPNLLKRTAVETELEGPPLHSF